MRFLAKFSPKMRLSGMPAFKSVIRQSPKGFDTLVPFQSTHATACARFDRFLAASADLTTKALIAKRLAASNQLVIQPSRTNRTCLLFNGQWPPRCADRTQAKRAGPKLEAGPEASAMRKAGEASPARDERLANLEQRDPRSGDARGLFV